MVRVGLIGTSWWAEAMYLPALADHPYGRITAICGRDVDKAARVAAEWDVPEVYASPEELFDHVDAVIVASSNASHHPIALAAMERGLHVLCEKPLGLDATQANELAAAAERHGAITMTPFTYRFMPMARQLRRHIDDGYVGTPFHLAARYYTGFARDGEYAWRFDLGESGSGVLGDIGSHWIDLATYLLGDIAEVGCVTNATVAREPRPDGLPYEAGEDVALTTLRFANGAIGHLIVSAVCWEGTPFNQTHHVEVHGSGGTLYALNDWDTVQEVRGLRAGETGPARPLDRPGDIWDGLRTGTVHDTYRDVFRSTEAMTRGWVTAVHLGEPVQPDIPHGAHIQRIVDTALRSAADGGRLLPVETTETA
ncbi:MAG: Gfo/Idh/MocA family protein [Ilumatobacteraceae bacterium]